MSQRPGLITWALGIRTTMYYDPGRHSLEDQIQSHGFLFLDEYLDSILSGPKQGPIIELVKTPGRKKAAPKRTRAATAAVAKTQSVISMSLAEEDAKENVPPGRVVNKFHQALLEVKEGCHSERDQDNTLYHSNGALANDDVQTTGSNKWGTLIAEEHATDSRRVAPNTNPSSRAADRTAEVSHRDPYQDAPVLEISHSEHCKDLSVIVEDDESAERSRISHQPALNLSLPVAEPVRCDDGEFHAMEDDDTGRMGNLTTSSSAYTFHSIPLNSPVTESTGFLTSAAPRDQPLTSTIPTHAIGKTLTRQSSMANLPTLPAPSPLRKSTKVSREPSMGITTAALAGHGMRTSWLTKAREAKALEVTSKRAGEPPSGFESNTVGPSGGMKRKSTEMQNINSVGTVSDDIDERKNKVPKINAERAVATELEGEIHFSRPPAQSRPSPVLLATVSYDDQAMVVQANQPEGMMDRFRKTVEGLGARVGKSMSKSLGGQAAATALAEARAAAEARVAERNAAEARPAIITPIVGTPETGVTVTLFTGGKSSGEIAGSAHLPHKQVDRRLSVSDLVSAFEGKGKGKVQEKVYEAPSRSPAPIASDENVLENNEHIGNVSISTTPPHSPPVTRPLSFAPNYVPVFKPAPPPKSNFQPAPSQSARPFSFQPPQPSADPLMKVPQGSQHGPTPLSSQSTFVSTQGSLVIFDQDEDIPAWMPSTQDTEYTQASQPKTFVDDDESDGEEGHHHWVTTALAGKDDDTWTTDPTDSGRHILAKSQTGYGDPEQHEPTIPGGFGMDVDEEPQVDLELVERGLEGELSEAGKSTISLVQAKSLSSSQASSSVSSSQLGFFGQATKLVNSVLGGSKKGKPEPVKSLQLAAVAAKKQQEELDKKAARLKEMENRRQMALLRKTEEEKVRILEEEKKIKEEGEKRKREREEHTEKRSLKQPGKKIGGSDDETTKKRKITTDVEKKVDGKKPPSKEKKDPMPPRIIKTVNSSVQLGNGLSKSTSIFKQSSASSAPSTTFNPPLPSASGSTLKLTAAAETKITKTIPANVKSNSTKRKGTAQDDGLLDKPPSLLMQSQMAARVQAQMQAIQATPPVTSESIDLPDINSEYSDSEDEDRPRTFDPPDWAQSPELRHALQTQSKVNPDTIFGAIKPLRMEEIFKSRTSRFRARTSSANWTGTDRLTASEELEYARRMGFQQR